MKKIVLFAVVGVLALSCQKEPQRFTAKLHFNVIDDIESKAIAHKDEDGSIKFSWEEGDVIQFCVTVYDFDRFTAVVEGGGVLNADDSTIFYNQTRVKTVLEDGEWVMYATDSFGPAELSGKWEENKSRMVDYKRIESLTLWSPNINASVNVDAKFKYVYWGLRLFDLFKDGEGVANVNLAEKFFENRDVTYEDSASKMLE